MVTTKLNLSMTEPSVRQIYAKQGDTGRVLDITLDQTPEDGTLRILRPDGTEVTSEAVTGGEVSESGETVTFESLTEADVTELTVGIEPVQDLNGYDAPWVGGAGKNLLNITTTTQTVSGVTFTVNSDGTIKANGTATARIALALATNVSETPILNKSVIMNGCPSGGSTNTYFIQWYGYDGASAVANDTGNGTSAFTPTSTAGVIAIVIQSGVAVNNLIFKPMIRLASETDPTWTPYSNICPITGHDEVRVTDEGTNLLNYDAWKTVAVTRGTAVWENNGVTLTATGTDCFTEWSNDAFPQGARVSVAEGETITLEWEYQRISGTSGGVVYIFPNGTTTGLITTAISNGSLSYTATSGVSYISFRFGISNAGTTVAFKNIQIVRGTTVPTWTPYVAPHTYTTSLGQTVYGGTLDMVTGQLVVDRAMVDLGTMTWERTTTSVGTYRFYTGGLGSVIKKPTTMTEISDLVCSQYVATYGNAPNASVQGICIHTNGNLMVYDSTLDTASATDFKTAMNGVTCVYPLATPLTYQLTPQQIKTLVGTNNVWASSGDIVNIKFAYGGLLSELPSEATEIVGKCYCDVEQNGVSSMPFTLNVKKNERAT